MALVLGAVSVLSPFIALAVLIECGLLEGLAVVLIGGPVAGMVGVIFYAIGHGLWLQVES